MGLALKYRSTVGMLRKYRQSEMRDVDNKEAGVARRII
jgi:hypothetical protein